MERRWLLIVILLSLSLAGYLLRAGYSIPPLYGTWLSSAATQLVNEGQPTFLDGRYMRIWMLIAIFGVLASLGIRYIDLNRVTPYLRPFLVASYSLLPLIVATAIPPFAWPLSMFVYIFATAVIIVALTSIFTIGLLLFRRTLQTGEGAYSSCRAVSLAVFALTLLDWANLILIGGS